jgi:hypothetical protein
LARTALRRKLGQLEEAFAGLRLGTFDDHHLLGEAVARLDEIPGIGPTAAAIIIIAEIGLDMSRFLTPAHLTSWAKFAPGINFSAGKTKSNGSTGHGNRYLARVLGEAVVCAGRTDTFLGARYRRLVTPTRQEEGHRRGRPITAGDHLASARPPTPASTTSVPTSTTATSTPRPNAATTSDNSKRSATKSPSNPQPERRSPPTPCLVKAISD